MKCPNCGEEFVPHRGRPTSVAAGESVRYAMSGWRKRIYALLLRCPRGLTDEQIVDKLGMNPNTERPRRVELFAMGRVRANGERKTRSGHKAVVWVAVQAQGDLFA